MTDTISSSPHLLLCPMRYLRRQRDKDGTVKPLRAMQTPQQDFEGVASELETQGWHREAQLLRRFPRSAWDDELVKGMFIAATTVRDLHRAEKLAQRLIAFAPDNPFAYLALCIVRLRQKRLTEAAQAFDNACYFASTLPVYRAQKVHWLCVKGKLDEAQEVLLRTQRDFPDRWEVQRSQAHLWLALGHTERATRLLRRIVRHRPADAIAHALLAQAFWRLGERQGADDHLRLMAKHLPTLTFTDAEKFVAYAVAKETLATRFWFLRPFWWWERKFLRLPPQKYFVTVGAFWFTVAIILALLNFVTSDAVFRLLVGATAAWCLYTRFADAILIWWMRR